MFCIQRKEQKRKENDKSTRKERATSTRVQLIRDTSESPCRLAVRDLPRCTEIRGHFPSIGSNTFTIDYYDQPVHHLRLKERRGDQQAVKRNFSSALVLLPEPAIITISIGACTCIIVFRISLPFIPPPLRPSLRSPPTLRPPHYYSTRQSRSTSPYSLTFVPLNRRL